MVEYIITPLLGGIIGYVTNDIAIRMLFRPHSAKYIFGWHVPFTPGIIPKEKGRIAESIGNVVSENLMNKDVLERYLLSDEMVDNVRAAFTRFIDVQKENTETVRELLSRFLSNGEVESVSNSVNQYLTGQMMWKLSDPAVGNKIAHLAMEYVSEKILGSSSKELVRYTGGTNFPGASYFIRQILASLCEPIEMFLSNTINEILQEKGESIVSGIIDGEVDSFLDKRVCELLSGHEEQLSLAINKIESLYRTLIRKHLSKMLKYVDIRRIVKDRINEMDVDETERLILKIMKKELNSIVRLGALLGFLIGCLNCFIL